MNKWVSEWMNECMVMYHNWPMCKGYWRFKQRLKVKNFKIKFIFKLGLNEWFRVLFSLWYLLFEGFKFQWQGLRATFLFYGRWDARTLGPHSVDGEEMKKDLNSESCQLRALQNSSPKGLGPGLCVRHAAVTHSPCVHSGPRPFRALNQAIQSVSTPAVAWMGVCRGRSVHQPLGQQRPRTEWGREGEQERCVVRRRVLPAAQNTKSV